MLVHFFWLTFPLYYVFQVDTKFAAKLIVDEEAQHLLKESKHLKCKKQVTKIYSKSQGEDFFTTVLKWEH